jgi:hypothetical protein
MTIEFYSVHMMVDIIKEFRLRGVEFECKIDDLGRGTFYIEEIERCEIISKITA